MSSKEFIPQLKSNAPKKTKRFYVTIHRWTDGFGRQISGFCVYDKKAQFNHVAYRTALLIAAQDECARLNRADL